jgi:hypothetical protein
VIVHLKDSFSILLASTMETKMHARIGYNEGGHTRYLVSDKQDVDTVEVPDDIWAAYVKHIEACRAWQDYMYKLDQQLTKAYHDGERVSVART